MPELTLSVMYGANELDVPPQVVLQQFEQQQRIQTGVRPIAWDNGRSQLVNIALYKKGADVSEMGTTWLSSFATPNVLRPFNEPEISGLGGSAAFLPIAWETGVGSDGRVWAVPWLADTRVIYYRRDWLARAGIDEETAFATFEKLAETLAGLKASGVAMPWLIPTHQGAITLHSVAPWVWAAGGDFMSEDGRHTRFAEPEALAGVSNYFQKQLPHLTPAVLHLTEADCNAVFQRGEAAAAVSGHWLLSRIRKGQAAPAVAENLGMAVFPGVPFVGGSNLVIWAHTRQAQAAVKLVEFLTSYEVQSGYVVQAGQIPARLDALAGPPFSTDPHFAVLQQSLARGRAFRANHQWATIEEKLSAAINSLWYQLLADPTLEVGRLVGLQLKRLAATLDQMLGEE